MNQILSVEMQKNNNARTKKVVGEGKASTRSVIMFFCIILIVFGITIVALGIFSQMNKDNQNQSATVNPNTQQTDKPKIEAIQNASEIEVEVSAKSIISKIEYNWNDGEVQQAEVNGTNAVSFNISNIPGGTNTLKIIAIDEKGESETFSKEYVGEQEAKAELSFIEDTGTLKVTCKEEKEIATISYNYDEEEPKMQQVNSTQAELEIEDIRQGEHTLTVTVTYSDGSSRKKMKKIYFPVVERVKVPTDGDYAMLKATDVRKITEVKMNLNGVDLQVETPNSELFERTLTREDGVAPGENRLILTVKNSEGVSITTRTKWIKTN